MRAIRRVRYKSTLGLGSREPSETSLSCDDDVVEANSAGPRGTLATTMGLLIQVGLLSAALAMLFWFGAWSTSTCIGILTTFVGARLIVRPFGARWHRCTARCRVSLVGGALLQPGQIWELPIKGADCSLCWLRATYHGTAHILPATAHETHVPLDTVPVTSPRVLLAANRPVRELTCVGGPVQSSVPRVRTTQGGTIRRLSQIGLQTMSSVLRKGSVGAGRPSGADAIYDYDAALERSVPQRAAVREYSVNAQHSACEAWRCVRPRTPDSAEAHESSCCCARRLRWAHPPWGLGAP